MKVSEVIKMMETNYKPDEELVILWWDKEWVENSLDPIILDEEEWNVAIALADTTVGESEHLQSRIGDVITEVVNEYLVQGEK